MTLLTLVVWIVTAGILVRWRLRRDGLDERWESNRRLFEDDL
jgi:hypothetical protein